MTHSELCKLYELKGQLDGRAFCLERDIAYTEDLIPKLVTEVYQKHFMGQRIILKRWAEENYRLRDEVERIIKEAENAEG